MKLLLPWWEARDKQIAEGAKVGDRVNVGWLGDSETHNYEDATLIWLHPYWYYPDGDINKREKRYQARVRFDDGTERSW